MSIVPFSVEHVEYLKDEIDLLRAELDQAIADWQAEQEQDLQLFNDWATRAEKAEARLAAVVALCDKYSVWVGVPAFNLATEVRAAATGDAPCA